MEDKMSMKVYVGNLAFSVKEDELREKFASFGELTEVTIIMDRMSGRSKGFGFVTFADDEAAKKAIAELDGKEFQGRNLKVNEARPMEERPQRSFGRRY
jgi:RNA recognition motif-containing protein